MLNSTRYPNDLPQWGLKESLNQRHPRQECELLGRHPTPCRPVNKIQQTKNQQRTTQQISASPSPTTALILGLREASPNGIQATIQNAEVEGQTWHCSFSPINS